jgi:CheY-like chemotaxis protein
MNSGALDTAVGKHPGNILIVDDVVETGEFFAKELRRYFEHVDTSSPERAEYLIGRGNFDALVTDLRFVGSRIDNGIELVKQLNGHCPPMVVLTASVSGKTLAAITSQAIHTDGTPLVRGAMKWGNIETLRAQILWAISDGAKLPPWARAEGIRKIKIPNFNTGEAPAELRNIIALLSEKLKNYVIMTRERLAILKEGHNLDEWPSWGGIKATVEGQLEQFSTYNSEKFIGTSERDTLEAMHELNSRIILLDMDILTPPDEYKSDEIYTILRGLRGSHHDITRQIESSFRNGEEVCNPMFNFDRDVERILSKWDAHLRIRYEDRDMEWRTRFRDNGRLVTTLFEQIQREFNESSCSIEVIGVDEESLYWNGGRDQQKLRQKINWGGGYKISIRWYHHGNEKSKFFGKKSYEQILDPLRSILEKLIKEKRIYIDPRLFSDETDEYGGSFEIFLKTEEADHEKIAREAAWEATIQTARIGEMFIWSDGRSSKEVYKIETPNGKMTLIGCSFPKRLKHMNGNFCATIHDGELIVASSHAHFECDLALCHYLVRRKKLSVDEAFQQARNSMRMKLEWSHLIVSHQKFNDAELPELDEICEKMWRPNYYSQREKMVSEISPVIQDLGIRGVICDQRSFFGRSEMFFIMVDYLLDGPEEHKESDESIIERIRADYGDEVDEEELKQLFFERKKPKDEWEDEQN